MAGWQRRGCPLDVLEGRLTTVGSLLRARARSAFRRGRNISCFFFFALVLFVWL